jgi:hypothetical protein
MKRLYEVIENPPNPVWAIMMVIAVLGLIGSVYLATPFFTPHIASAGGASVVETLASKVGLLSLAIVSFISNSTLIIGLVKHSYKLQAWGLFFLAVIRLYVIFALILVDGFFPLSWLANFTVMSICAICYLYVKAKQLGEST